MLTAIKSFMNPEPLEAARRDAERDLERARSELKARTTDLGTTTAEHGVLVAALESLQAAFDDDPSDGGADRVLEAKAALQRGDLFLQREKRREQQAQAKVRDAEATLQTAERAILAARVDPQIIQAKYASGAAKVAKAVQLLTEAQAEAEAIEADVREAASAIGLENPAVRSSIVLAIRAALDDAGDRHYARVRQAALFLDDRRPRR